MDNKHFKKLLKESLENGAQTLFEEEEDALEPITSDDSDEANSEGDREDGEQQDDDKVKKTFLEYFNNRAKKEIDRISTASKLETKDYAMLASLYYLYRHHLTRDEEMDTENLNRVFKNNAAFNKIVFNLLSTEQKNKKNIICVFAKVANWLKTQPLYKNPEVYYEALIRKLGSKGIEKIVKYGEYIFEKNSYSIKGKNKRLLEKLAADSIKLGIKNISDCPKGADVTADTDGEKDGESEEKDEAVEEFQKLDLKVGDVVVVRNRNGKEIVTTVAEIPEELIVKENQWKDETVKFIIGGDWSIPLDGKRGFNSKGQHWIAIRDKKVAIRKATTQDIQKAVEVDPRVAAKLNLEDTLEDAETEEIPREDVETYGTPEEPQAFRTFLKGLQKVPVIRDYADEIVAALKKDIPSTKQASMMPNTIDELLTINEEEDEGAKYKLPDSENIQNIIKKIANDKLVAGKWAYTLIKRFLSRNGMDLKQNAEINMKALKVIPKPEDIVPLLKTAKAVERNLEEQRYYMLLKRFNIK